VARWGVSEFAVIMPGEDHYGATKAIEKVLPALNRQMITTPAGKPLPITLCAGLTLVNNQTPLEDAAATAECHLYMAFHQAWHNPRKNWLVSDAIQVARRSETIALLQPDPMMAKVLQQVLERETFKVQSFSSSKELRSALNQQAFNLLIMDGNLPEAEGQAIREEIRGLPNQRQLLTMMIVGDDSGIERSLKLGVHDYAIKPLSVPRVRSQILRLLWQREESRSHARMTVMVVDHEVPQLLISGTALHQLGECQVLLARGPQDAIRRLLHTQPHYLVLDMTMPEMSGEEFMRAIPDLDWLKNMEIIMAAPASFSLPAQNSARTVLGVISRPYRPIKFIKEIRDLIPMLQNDTLPPPPFLPAPLEAEVQRILSL
jgi:PleD family two-component response regulator